MIPSSSSAAMPVSARARASSAPRRRDLLRPCHHRQHHLQRMLGRPTRRIARSWVANSSGRASASRTPRTPRNGFASGGIGRAGSGLSAPASSVRTISGRPSSARAISRRVSACSSSLGSSARSRNRNSVRSSPTPSAPELHGRRRLGRGAEVGEHLDPRSVPQGAGLRGARAGHPRRSAARRAAPRRRARHRLWLDRRPSRRRRRAAGLPRGSRGPPRRGRDGRDARARARGSPHARSPFRGRWRCRDAPGSNVAVSAGVSSFAITIPSGLPSRSFSPVIAPTITAGHVEHVDGTLAQQLGVEAAEHPRRRGGVVDARSALVPASIAARAGRAPTGPRAARGGHRRSPHPWPGPLGHRIAGRARPPPGPRRSPARGARARARGTRPPAPAGPPERRRAQPRERRPALARRERR